MATTALELPAETLTALRALAAKTGSSLDAMVRVAVETYLLQAKLSDSEWLDQWHSLAEEVQSQVPPNMTPEEIDAEVDAAIREVRLARRARGN